VILVHRTAHDLTGKPLEWRATRGGAEGFQYQTEIR
jgi:GntR family transcriptional regulator